MDSVLGVSSDDDLSDNNSVGSTATGVKGTENKIRDTVAVKWDEKEQMIKILCLWRGWSSTVRDSTYQTMKDIEELTEKSEKRRRSEFGLLSLFHCNIFLTMLCFLVLNKK